MRNKILLIEDDLGLAITLKDFFEDNALSVCLIEDGGEALTIFKRIKPDLILLDIILPNKNGFEIASEIRTIKTTVPIIMMTGMEFNSDSEIKGYELGAINYMKKPIVPQAVLALIRNILTLPKDLKQHAVGNYLFRLHSQSIEINNEKYNLRDKDAKLFGILLDRQNQIVSRKTILQQIWMDDNSEKNNHLDGAVLRLRRLFYPYQDIQIKTIYGNGYMLKID